MKEKFIVNQCYASLENTAWYIKELAERMDKAGYKVVNWTVTAIPPDHPKRIEGEHTYLFCMLGELKDAN